MLNCPKCGLTITDTHKNCPKCRTKIEDMKLDNTDVVKKNSMNIPSQQIKEEMIEAVIRAEETAIAATNTNDPTPEETILAAVVEAEALAAIEEENEEKKEKNVCEICQTIIKEDQTVCESCGSVIENATPIEQEQIITPKTDEQANKWIAAIGYVIFFFPLIFNYYKESAFAKFHAKQATSLFLASIILFLGLLLLRNTMDDWFLTNADHVNYVCTPVLYGDGEPICIELQPAWHHGHGFAGGAFYYYLRWMLFALHFVPFGWMIIGIINALQGQKRVLPIIGCGCCLKKENQEFEQLNLFNNDKKADSH